MQYDEAHSLQDTRTPLNRLVGLRSELSLTHATEPERKINREMVKSIEEATITTVEGAPFGQR